MNERTMRDRFHALGPLVLRVGLAIVLAHNGLQRTAGFFEQDQTLATQAQAPPIARAEATPTGVQLMADWSMLLGMGELAAAALLLIGLCTRLVVLPTLAVLGYGLFVGFPDPSLPANTMAMWLLAVACLSLLVSGGGSLALRRRKYVPAPVAQPSAFVPDRPPVTQRFRDWLGRRRTTERPAQPVAPATARRWKWGRRRLA